MKCGTVFTLLFITLASCRNIPGLQDKLGDYVSRESNVVFSGKGNNGLIRESSGNLCVSDKNTDCEEKRMKWPHPPQIPKLKGIQNEDEKIWLQSPYQINHNAKAGNLGVSVGSHGGVLYPYAHPSLFAALNPPVPVSRLPPVFTTHIREVPPYFVPYLYGPKARFTREDEEDDFLDQLNHDAIMEYVLPTMSVTRSSYGSQVPLTVPTVALFPTNGAGCGIPLLLSCSLNISRGVLVAHKNHEPTVITKYRAKIPSEKKEEDDEAKSTIPITTVL